MMNLVGTNFSDLGMAIATNIPSLSDDHNLFIRIYWQVQFLAKSGNLLNSVPAR